MSDEQAVAEEVNAQAAPAAATEGAQDDLDALLSEYDSAKTTPPEPPKTDEPDSQPDPKVSELHNRLYRMDMDNLVKGIRGEVAGVTDRFVETWADSRARDDERLQKAWLNRHANPDGFAKVVAGLSKQFAKEIAEIRSVDAQATEDRRALESAVRGASTAAPTPDTGPDFSKMSDSEFNRYKASLR